MPRTMPDTHNGSHAQHQALIMRDADTWRAHDGECATSGALTRPGPRCDTSAHRTLWLCHPREPTTRSQGPPSEHPTQLCAPAGHPTKPAPQPSDWADHLLRHSRGPPRCPPLPRAIPPDATREPPIRFPLCPQASQNRITAGQNPVSLWTTRDQENAPRNDPRKTGQSWLMRTRLPAGSRNEQSRTPHGWSSGSCSTSPTPVDSTHARARSKVPCRSFVASDRAV